MSNISKFRLPDFIAVGPARTATTWLHTFLEDRVSLPEGVKETNFFSWNYQLGLDWYLWHFRHARPEQPVGEFGAAYFELEASRERIFKHIPESRIVCIFRDPVDRMYSHYKLWRKIGLVDEPFGQIATRNPLLQSINRYAFHLSAWQSRFRRDCVLVLFYEDLINNPQSFFDVLCSFLGIATFTVSESPLLSKRIHSVESAPRSIKLARFARETRGFLTRHRLHRIREVAEPLWQFCFTGGEVFEPLDPELDRKLRLMLRPEIEEFEQLVGRDLSAWKHSR